MTDLNIGSVRALIFDLDGTLIDSKQDLIHSVNAMLRELGRRELAEETISGYIGHGAPQLVARALGSECTEEERQRALQFFLSYYELHKMDTTCTYPGVAKTLEKLADLPMAV
jgi:phosphoglycolate phosphatase